jgi:hypothetical protein
MQGLVPRMLSRLSRCSERVSDALLPSLVIAVFDIGRLQLLQCDHFAIFNQRGRYLVRGHVLSITTAACQGKEGGAGRRAVSRNTLSREQRRELHTRACSLCEWQKQ